MPRIFYQFGGSQFFGGGGGAPSQSQEDDQDDLEGFGQGLGIFGRGLGIGSTISSFLNQRRAGREAEREQRRAYFTSLDVLKDLLGTGFNLGGRQAVLDPEVLQDPDFQKLSGLRPDQVVAPGSLESRFVPAGTVIARRPGDKGMDPAILRAREALAGVTSSQAINKEERARLNEIQTGQLGQALSARPTTGNLRANLGALLGDVGQAGTGIAQNELGAAIMNRQFGTAARTGGLDFIQRLFSLAGSTF